MPKWGAFGENRVTAGFTGSTGLGNFQGNTFFWILPFLEQGRLMLEWNKYTSCQANPAVTPPRIFLCPVDPTMPPYGVVHSDSSDVAVTSYAANMQVFYPNEGKGPSPNLASMFVDGTSDTALLFERYSVCQNANTVIDIMDGSSIEPTTSARSIWGIGGSTAPFAPPPGSAEKYGYVLPIAYWNLGSDYSPPTAVFQNMPPAKECNPSNMQTPHDGVMNVLMADASVHGVAAGVSLSTYRAAITPAGNDILGDDW